MLVTFSYWLANANANISLFDKELNFSPIWIFNPFKIWFGINEIVFNVNITLSGWTTSSKIGCCQCCFLHAACIVTNPEPARSPIPIRENILCKVGFLGSLSPPFKALSFGILKLPGLLKIKVLLSFSINILPLSL